MSEAHANFKTRIGFLVVAAGSAIGLGNIWRFPYLTGQNGGGAFVLLYLFFAVFVGALVILAEVLLGRLAQRNAVDAFGIHKADGKSPSWKVVGGIAIFGTFLITLYYPIVAGWTVEYIFASPSLVGNPEGAAEIFTYISGPEGFWWAFLATTFVIVFTNVIVGKGLVEGTEKAGVILMPLLFVLLIVLALRALTLDNAGAGVHYYLTPDFSKISYKTALAALGQAFFSLSVGCGMMVTFGSYLGKKTCSVKNSFAVMAADTLVALLAGFIIMPALFAYNIEPGAGSGLTFISMIKVFGNMMGGAFWAPVFFFLMFVAAFTTTLSQSETIANVLEEKFRTSRKKAVFWLTVAQLLFAWVSLLSLTGFIPLKLMGKNLFDFFDYVSGNVTIPFSALVVCLYVGIYHRKTILAKTHELVAPSLRSLVKPSLWLITFVLPIIIVFVLINGLM